MTRAEERAVRAALRRASREAILAIVAWHAPHNEPEGVMDELWTQKAALGEMLRRGEFG